MKRHLLAILMCSGCVLNTNAPTEQAVLDDGAIRVAPLRLTLEDGVDTVTLENLSFATPDLFDHGHDSLPFEHAGHELALEASQIARMVAVGGEVGLTIDGDYRVVTLSHVTALAEDDGSSGTQELEFDFTLEGRVIHATLEVLAEYHCPPFPTTPANPEKDGPPAVSASPL